MRGTLVAAVLVLLLGNVVALAANDDEGASLAGATTTSSVATPVPPAPPGAPTTAPATPPSSVATSGKPPANVAPTTPTTATTAPSTPSPTALPSGYVYDVSVDPVCTKVGAEVTITFKVEPGSGVAWMPVFADGDTHGFHGSAIARDNGVVTGLWKAPPVPGDGLVVTQASDGRATRTGRTDLAFRIVEPTGSC